MGMWNYAREDWPAVRDKLTRVPLHHCLWSVDDSLGDHIWLSSSIRDTRPRQPPPQDFRMPLLPIEACIFGSLNNSALAHEYHCEECPAKFPSVGGFLRYCRVEHSRADYYESSEAQGLDWSTYWTKDGKWICQECKKAYPDENVRKMHVLKHHLLSRQKLVVNVND
jgi:hypothetical protein